MDRRFIEQARPFAEAARRAQIIALVNSAHTDSEVADATVQQLCEALDAEIAFVAVTHPHSGGLELIGEMGLTWAGGAGVPDEALCRSALGALRAETHHGDDLLGLGARHLVLCPWRGDGGRHVLVGVVRLYDEAFDRDEIALAEAVTESVGHAVERAWLGAERDRHASRKAALARAATTLSASLVPEAVLQTLAEEVAAAFDSDTVAVLRVGDEGTLQPAVVSAMPRIDEATEELCRDVARVNEPLVRRPASAMAAPVHVHGAVRAVVVVACRSGHQIDSSDVDLLTAFTDLARITWRNAADHAAVRRAAELDSLTGCLNHGAFQSRLRDELARAERTGTGCALVLVDLNDFKAVNDTFGHLTGDALLRMVADGLRGSVRAYDHVGRYGGDEFAVLLPATEEDVARRLADRVLAVTSAVELPGGVSASASAGVAAWRPGDSADALIGRADHAMLEVKRSRQRGTDGAAGAGLAVATGDGRERQRLRRLARAAAIGTRLVRLLDAHAIAEAATADLAASLGYDDSIVIRREGEDGAAVAAIHRGGGGRTDTDGPRRAASEAMRERRTVLIVDPEPKNGSAGSASTLAVPVYTGGEIWGAIAVRSAHAIPLDDVDAELVGRVADHLGAALQTAQVYDELEQTHVGTAAALAAALEAKDAYTGNHARSIANLAVAVGAELGLDHEQRRTLRYGALFHDIGKIAIPDAILNKPGPLTEAELAVVRTHPEVGEQILGSVPFLADVREVVRHDHERWDGYGYPDGLCGDAIPIGARIVLVVDAYHAMRSDRPYRRRMRASTARAELMRQAGAQFDPAVVHALLTVLEREPEVEVELA